MTDTTSKKNETQPAVPNLDAMSKGELIAYLKSSEFSVEIWNKWRTGQGYRYIDLSNSNLSNSDLSGSNLSGSDLSNSDLGGSNLSNSDLSGSNLSNSNLRNSDLSGSNLGGSDLSNSDLPKGLAILKISPLGSERRELSAILNADGLTIRTGCFENSIEAFELAVAYKHGDSTYGKEYDAAVVMIRAWHEIHKDRIAAECAEVEAEKAKKAAAAAAAAADSVVGKSSAASD